MSKEIVLKASVGIMFSVSASEVSSGACHTVGRLLSALVGNGINIFGWS